MTKQEMLYEQYNDALFRLLMHSVAQHQGQQYQEENQALKAQEGGPSETAKRRCLRTISRQVRRGHARAAARTASRVLSKAAVVMLLVISCLTAAFAVSPVFRSDALRWAVATFGDHAEYRFNQTEGGVSTRASKWAGCRRDMSWWKVGLRIGRYCAAIPNQEPI